jgi:hypothetical protein
MSQIILNSIDFSNLGIPQVGEFFFGIDVDGVPKLKRNDGVVLMGISGDEYLKWNSVTFNQFNNLISTNGLQNGGIYIINDFRTSHYIQYTDSVGDGTGFGESIHVGDLEPLLIIAVSSNGYNPLVKSLIYPDDIIIWKHDQIDGRGDYAQPQGRGHITYRESPIGNSRGYDFRNVIFYRWNNGSGEYTIWNRTLAPNQFDFIEVKSFDESFFNIIDTSISPLKGGPYDLDNFIISTQSTSFGNNILNGSRSTILSSTFSDNRINKMDDSVVINTTFTDNTVGNIVGSTFSGMTFSENWSNRLIGISQSTDIVSKFEFNSSGEYFNFSGTDGLLSSTFSQDLNSDKMLVWDDQTYKISYRNITGITGPQGPTGPIGVTGPTGPTGVAVVVDSYTQSTQPLLLGTDDEYYGVSWSSTHIFTLPNLSGVIDGKRVIIKDESGSSSINPIIIESLDSTIDGFTQSILSIDRGSITIIKKLNGWWII